MDLCIRLEVANIIHLLVILIFYCKMQCRDDNMISINVDVVAVGSTTIGRTTVGDTIIRRASTGGRIIK